MMTPNEDEMMPEVDFNLDTEVGQMHKLLAIVMDTHHLQPAARLYAVTLDEEYDILKAHCAKVEADEEGELCLDEDILFDFIKVIDEIKAFVKSCL
jgi:hypothetical protein